MSIITSIIITLLVLSLIVVLHEFGHFIAARLNNIAVLEFAIGMGPAFFKKQFGETLFTLRAFPIGGFCKMLGEDESNGDPRAFNNKKPWQRLIVLVSGALLNFVLAFILALIFISFTGVSDSVISGVVQDSPADDAGILAGDRITKINNSKINIFEDLSFAINIEDGKPLVVEILRNGEKMIKEVTPVYNAERKSYMIGISNTGKLGIFQSEIEGADIPRAGVLETVKTSYLTMLNYIRSTLVGLQKIVTGQLGVDKLSGPVYITRMINEKVEIVSSSEEITFGDKVMELLFTGISLCAAISANIGVFNLLPLPALDGGRCIFVIIEAIRRKPVDPNKEDIVHMIGFVAMMALAVFILFGDFMKQI